MISLEEIKEKFWELDKELWVSNFVKKESRIHEPKNYVEKEALNTWSEIQYGESRSRLRMWKPELKGEGAVLGLFALALVVASSGPAGAQESGLGPGAGSGGLPTEIIASIGVPYGIDAWQPAATLFLLEQGGNKSAPNLFGVDAGVAGAAADGRRVADVMFESLQDGREVNLNLSEQLNVKLRLEEEQDRHFTPGFRTWRAVDLAKDANLVMVDNGRVLDGQLRMGGKLYRFWPQPGGKVLIGEDTSILTPENDLHMSREVLKKYMEENPVPVAGNVLKAAEGNVEVKVGIFFDKTAQDYYISPEVLAAEGAMTVAYANGVFADSGIAPRYVLGYSGSFGYDSTGYTPIEVFGHLLLANDGRGDDLQQIWNEKALDQVLVVINSNTSWQGISVLGGAPSKSFAPYMASMVNVTASDLVWLHEMMHADGACHSAEENPVCYGVSPTAMGYHSVNDDDGFSTVMAYPQYPGRPWIDRASARDKFWNGEATGTVLADNAEAMNYALPYIAQYHGESLQNYMLFLPQLMK